MLAWCCGVEALAPALAAASADEQPFDRAYTLRIACLPFVAKADRAAAVAGLLDMIAGAVNPYDTLTRAGRLERLPAEMLPALRQVLEQRCDFDMVRSEAGALAVRAAALGESAFAESVARRLMPARPETACAVWLALGMHAAQPAERIAHVGAAAQAAVRVVNPVNKAGLRSDTIARLAPALLALPRAAAAETVGGMLAALADAPRARLLLDLAALAPVFAALGDAQVETGVDQVLARVRRWWP